MRAKSTPAQSHMASNPQISLQGNRVEQKIILFKFSLRKRNEYIILKSTVLLWFKNQFKKTPRERGILVHKK